VTNTLIAIGASVLVVSGLVAARPAFAQTVQVRGTVTDSASGAPVVGVQIAEVDSLGRTAHRSVTDLMGRFQVVRPAGTQVTFQLTRLGYRPQHLQVTMGQGSDTGLVIQMSPVSVPLDEIVVSAERTPGVAFDAPVSVAVIARDEIAAAPTPNASDHVADVPGVHYAAKGIMSRTYGVRGGIGTLGGGVLAITDYRYTALPSLGFNMPALDPISDLDIERIEVVRGPTAALYGPTSTQGVVHTVTRSPFESRGTSVRLGRGERALTEIAARHAGVVGTRFGYRVSAQWIEGRDWAGTDAAEATARAAALAAGANPDTLRIGRRLQNTNKIGASLQAEWRAGESTSLVVDAGATQFSGVELPGIGATQGRDWWLAYTQARFRVHQLFVNATASAGDARGSYYLRTGLPIVDRSRVATLQVQHGLAVGNGNLTYGVDAQWTTPRTGGTIDGANEDRDNVAQYGAFVSATQPVIRRFEAVAALRADYHDRLRSLGWSPRVGMVFRPSQTHVARFTYSVGFSVPAPNDLFADLLVSSFPGGLPYGVRYVASPLGGLSFRRDCSGLCMRSPFAADPSAFLPTDATLLWPAVVGILQRRGIDIAAIPAPGGASVATQLRLLNTSTSGFEPVAAASVQDIAPRRPTTVNSIEIGYRVVLGPGTAVSIDVYRNRLQRLLPDARPVTPNVFLDSASLAQYLGTYMPAAQAAQLAGSAATIPLGTVSPVQSRYPSDVLIAYPSQEGTYTVWGAEVTAEVRLTARFTATVGYTWASRDSVAGLPGSGGLALDNPRHRGAVALRYADEGPRLTVELRGRALGPFPVAQGVQRGRLPAYEVVDVSAGWRLPVGGDVRLLLEVTNVFDKRHQETVAAPFIGRLAVARLQFVM
jgi:outer membrane receptor for ferrienterochelin and colicins